MISHLLLNLQATACKHINAGANDQVKSITAQKEERKRHVKRYRIFIVRGHLGKKNNAFESVNNEASCLIVHGLIK